MSDENELLDRFARTGDEDAFRDLIEHHVDLVYSTALRQVNGDAALAKDVTQSVFMDLARKAKSLPPDIVIAGWLYGAARFAAANAVRNENRRKAREREAIVMHHIQSSAEPDWGQVGPALDAAMAELSPDDRSAVLLRYFQKRDFHRVGKALGISDDAAQKRVSRAVERLRSILGKRGIIIGAHGLVAMISIHAVQAAPAGLSILISSAALAASTMVTTASSTLTKVALMNTFQKVLVAAAITAGVGTGIYEARKASVLRRQIQTLQTTAEEQARTLAAERGNAVQQVAATQQYQDIDGATTRELLQLRGEVNMLRRERDELQARVAGLTKSNTAPARIAATTAQPGPVDTAWVRKILDGQPKERGTAAGAVRGKQLRGDTNLSASEIALRDALQTRRDGESLERSPAGFADFQSAFIQEVVGITDGERISQIRDIIEKTYEYAVANGLDVPSKPASDSEEWVQRRFQLDRQATAQVKELFTDGERRMFNRAFLGVMGADLGMGVDKSNYPKGFLGPSIPNQ